MTFQKAASAVDKFAQILLEDGQLYISGTETEVQCRYQPRNSCMVAIRRFVALASLLAMITWLVWNVTQKDLNGLVPGIW